MNSARQTILFLSHGGGPMPLLGDAGHQEMINQLKTMAQIIQRPSAILVISAHWETPKPSITSGAQPQLIYDYYGFPAESYTIQYPAPGHPELAKNVHTLLKQNGVDSSLDDLRGFDHGVFVPLEIMYPEADIPCVQLSLVNTLDPTTHIEMGRALSKIPEDNLLIIGSGFSFHNMRAFFAANTLEARSQNEAFEHWLIETCSNPQLSEPERTQRLKNWTAAPAARYCHPREEHLLPLHVCYGAAQRPCSEIFTMTVLGKKASAYLWQPA